MKKRLLSFTVVIATLVLLGGHLFAIPDSQFELEGNAVVDGIGDDWQNTVPKSATSEALVSTFVADGSGNATIFTGGGSKDISDIDQWKWKDQLGGLPDKDNITNAYAAAYANAQGDLTIYFGADRFATAGDAQLGFWFFHQRVQTVGDQFVGSNGQPAQHTLGDILVLANFSNGGSQVEILVFRWVGGNNPLALVASATQGRCGENTDPNVCAITNTTNATAPWSYTPKTGNAGTFPPVSFFEGGINLSAFLQTQVGGCFSSFMAETRSSTSTTAVLKDFALGEFDTCKLEIAKSCSTVTFDGTNLNYTSEIIVTNKGFGTVFDVTMTDTPTAPGAPQTFTLAQLAKNVSHTFTHTFSIAPSPTSPNPPLNIAVVTAAILPGGAQVVGPETANATCPQVSFDAALTITKTCTAGLEVQNGKVVVVVNISGQVCNVPPASGPFPESISNVSITDTPPFEGQPISIGTLTPGQCQTYTAKYYPSALQVIGGQPSGNAGDQVYLDTAAVTGTGAISGGNRVNTVSANCPLCPPCVGANCATEDPAAKGGVPSLESLIKKSVANVAKR